MFSDWIPGMSRASESTWPVSASVWKTEIRRSRKSASGAGNGMVRMPAGVLVPSLSSWATYSPVTGSRPYEERPPCLSIVSHACPSGRRS